MCTRGRVRLRVSRIENKEYTGRQVGAQLDPPRGKGAPGSVEWVEDFLGEERWQTM